MLYKDTGNKEGGEGNAPTADETQKAYDEWLANKERMKDSKLNLNDWINNG